MPSYTYTFSESTERRQSAVINIPNLQSVTGVSANTGIATYSVQGNSVSIAVDGGTHSRYTSTPSGYTDKKNVTDSGYYPKSQYSTCASKKNYSDAQGYTGTLSLVSCYFDPGDFYQPPTYVGSYSGSVSKWVSTTEYTYYYNYSVTISYEEYPSPDTTPPANVTNLTTSNVTSTSLTLNWSPSISGDVASYDIFIGSTRVGNVSAATYNITGLTANTQYTFTVKAIDAVGNVANGTNVTITTALPPDTTPPENVTNLVISNLTETSLLLNWTASSSVDVAFYEIYRDSTQLTMITQTSYAITGLTPGATYIFTVKAKDSSGNLAVGTSVTVTTSLRKGFVKVSGVYRKNVGTWVKVSGSWRKVARVYTKISGTWRELK